MIDITFIANCGVLVTYEHTKILIDALYDGNVYGLSNIPEGILSMIISGQEPFNNIDYILFTHDHPDHFSAKLLKEYLLHNHITGLFVPQRVYEKDPELKELAVAGSDRLISEPYDICETVLLNEKISLEFQRTLHVGAEFRHVKHYCFTLFVDGKKLLFTSDIDYLNEDGSFIINKNIDAAFVNPLTLNAVFGEKKFGNLESNGKIILYHMPFPEDDTKNFSMLVKKYAGKCIVFDQALQTVSI